MKGAHTSQTVSRWRCVQCCVYLFILSFFVRLSHSPFKNQIHDCLYNSSSPTVKGESSEFAFVFQESECAWERPWLAWSCFCFWPPLYRISIWNLRLIQRTLKRLQWPVLLAVCHLHTSCISFLVKEQTGCCYAGVCDFFPEAWPSSFPRLGIPLSFILSHLSFAPQSSEHPSSLGIFSWVITHCPLQSVILVLTMTCTNCNNWVISMLWM